MSITEGTQPSPTHPTGTTTTTAAFTPEANSLLVALVAANGTSTATTTASVSDSLSGSWTLLKRQNTAVSGPPDVGGTCEVWIRDIGSSPSSMTVTASGWASNAGNLTVRTLIGAKPVAQQTGATGGAGGGNIAPTCSLTPTQIGSRIYGAALDYTTNATLTANGNTTSIDQFADATNGDTWATFKSSGDTASLSSTSYGYTNASAAYNIAAAEILAAATGASQPGIAFHPGRGPSTARFFQPPRDTTSFSAALTDAGSASDALTVIDATVGARSPGGFHPGRGPTSSRFFQPPRDYTVAGTTQVALSDSGSADDSQLAVSATVPLSDTGSASEDSGVVSATVPLSDAGSAAEDSGVVSATVPLTDSGTATDTLTVADITVGARAPSPLHPGRGPTSARFFQPPRSTDLVLPTAVTLTDSGSASDALSVTATVPLADAASAADALAVSATVPLADAGVASETTALTATITLADAAAALDAISVNTGITSVPGVLTNATIGPRLVPASAASRSTGSTASARSSTSSMSGRINPKTSGGQA